MKNLITATILVALSAGAHTLQGNVSHSERLVDNVPVVGAKAKWFRIPSWLAGTWKEIESSNVYEFDERTQTEDRVPHSRPPHDVLTFAWQRDADGGYWQQELQTREDRNRSIKSLTATAGDNAVNAGTTFRTVEIVSATDRPDTKSATVEKHEIVQRIAPLSWDPDVIIVDSDQQNYDSVGSPTNRIRTLSVYKRTSDYSPKDLDGERDLRAYFVQFLRENGLRTLIPADKPKSEDK